MADTKKKPRALRMVLPLIIGAGVGFGMGVGLVALMENTVRPEGVTLPQLLIRLGLTLLLLYGSIYVQLVLHEAGHLVAGLLSGYRFVSFRIGSFLWMRVDGRLVLRRISIAGTGGQCLMSPPELVDGKMPCIRYNLGGCAANLLTAALFGALFASFPQAGFFAVFCVMMAMTGLAIALMNGVPMRVGGVDNDGYNTLSLGKSPEAVRALWLQLRINEALSQGQRLREMPQEWFVVPTDEQLSNSMVASVAVFACNRLMDEQRFDEADALMARLLDMETGIIGLHRSLLVCDRIYCELIGENRADMVEEMLDKSQQQFMKSMAKFPSVLRTRYVLAVLGTSDGDAASKIRKQFEQIALHYPYLRDIESERDLMNAADEKALVRTA